ncbi:MAG: peptidylprolyl isomerase [Oscillospiraceae bacterium]|nr:peptidylprolyl isomerase [Oscillospiraceae bacterium]
MKLNKLLVSVAMILSLVACNGNNADDTPVGNLREVSLEPGDIYAIISIMDYGDISVKLFPDVAPVAVEKFAALAGRGFYERKTIHRVLSDSFIQGGSLNGDGTDGNIDSFAFFDTEPSDYAKNFYGALCFAPNREGQNFSQFYIINNNQPVNIDGDIQILEEQLNDKTKIFSEEVRERYEGNLALLKSIPEDVKARYLDKGGLYSLDGSNTVFGQIVSGYDVLEAISNTQVVSGNYIDDSREIFSKPANTIIIEKVEIIRIPLPEPTTIPEETRVTRARTQRTQRETTPETRPEEAFTAVVPIGSSG